jgi:hypothetical protein
MKRVFKKNQVNLKSTLPGGARPHLPNERDEIPEQTPDPPRKIIEQAHRDLQRGLVDTDLHGERGVEVVHSREKKKNKDIH